MVRSVVVVVLTMSLAAGCRPSIGDLNTRPHKHYQQQVKVRGRVSRIEPAGGATLLELEDARGARLIVAMSGPVEARVDDWVKVVGVLVPEQRVAGRIVYDVVAGEKLSQTRRPWLADLF